MFKKCLKYDLRSIWRVWWILALVAAGAGVLGCVSLRSIETFAGKGGFINVSLSALSILGLIASIIAIVAFVVMTMILVYLRFYKHFYSDEGYLTFALPVKRSTLYLSKVVNALIWTVATILLIFLIVLGVLLCADVGVTFSQVLSVLSLKWLWDLCGAWSIAYLLEFLVGAVLVALLQCGMLHFCITIGAVIAKKHKIIAAIGIYYGFSIVLGFIMEFISIFASIGVVEAAVNILDDLDPTLFPPLLALLFLAICTALAAGAILLHYVTLALIERKLNLE